MASTKEKLAKAEAILKERKKSTSNTRDILEKKTPLENFGQMPPSARASRTQPPICPPTIYRSGLCIIQSREQCESIELEKKEPHRSTSTRTRDKLAEVEAAISKEKEASKTSTRTRDLLAEKVKEYENLKGTTGTNTRLELAHVEAAIARKKEGTKTSTRTRELLNEKLKEYDNLKETTGTNTRLKLAEVEASLEKLRVENTNSSLRRDFENRQRLIEYAIKKSKDVDLVFLVDCTGSMIPYIKETKNQIRSIVQEIKSTFGNEIRIGFVGYRDHCDGPKRIEKVDLDEDVSKFQNFLARIKATGGGDEPEDIFGGIEATLGLSWSKSTKVLIHIGDAPPHGSRFNNCGRSGDHYSKYNRADVRGLKIEDLLRRIKESGIAYYFGKVNNSTNKMVKEFNRVGGNGTVSEIDVKDPKALWNVTVNSVSDTIHGSMAKTRVSFAPVSKMTTISELDKSLKDYSICEMDFEPNWSRIHVEKVQWLCCSIPDFTESREIVKRIGSIDHKWKTEAIKLASDPFAEGAQRISYKGFKGMSGPGGDPTSEKQAIVLKEFKHFGKGRDRREDYIEIMESQAVSAYMAKQFNALTPTWTKSVEFLEVSVIQVNQPDGTPKYYNVEVLLEDYKTNYMKWNNNSGYVNLDEFAATLDAFCHWTYDVTEGYLMVVDLQGVLHGTNYVLTDPSIHCKEPRFGSTNFGAVGFKSFFQNHSCGEVCQRMGLKSNTYMTGTTPRRISKKTCVT